MNRPLISVVVPCYNESAVLRETHRRLSELAVAIGDATFEFLFVDDGSHDETPALLLELSNTDARVRGIRLSRNFHDRRARACER
jgi:dolichol-phosphate mannosyltransferase